MKKRLLSICLVTKVVVLFVFVFVLLLCSCNTNPGSKQQGGTRKQYNENDILFCSVPNTEKVLQDQPIAEYSDVTGSDSLLINAVKNEHESAQLVLTANADIENYHVEVSALTNGQSTISKDNITVYNQKYVEVVTKTNNVSKYPSGMYPDGLLLIDKAEKFGETAIKSGNNQSIWVSVYVPKDAVAGTYSGTLTVKYGNIEHKTPIELIVYDYTLSDEMHQQSSFSITWPYQNGELDTSYEMYLNYRDALLEYRLSTEFWRGQAGNGDKWFEDACEYARNPYKPMIILPYSSGSINGETAYNLEEMTALIKKFALRSKLDGYNYLEQCMVYFGMLIDEPQPDQTEKVAQLKAICKYWNKMREDIANELYSDVEFNTNNPIAQEIIDSTRKIQHILVGYNHGDHEDAFGEDEATWCPTPDYLMSAYDHYSEQDTMWWYTMLAPKEPYPNFHVDGTLLAERVIGWMQYDYNILGHLNWAVNNYVANDGNYVEDYYGLYNAGGIANGDGWLFYPGAKYEIDGPIPTIRLAEFRDSLEEYEILYDLGNKYQQITATVDCASDFKTILHNYTQYLYESVSCKANSSLFNATRLALLNMAEMSNTNSAFLVGYQTSGANTNYKLIVKDGLEVTKQGQSVTKTQTYSLFGSTYGLYSIDVSDNTTEMVAVAQNGKQHEFNIKIAGKTIVFTNDSFASSYFEFTNGGSAEKTTYQGATVTKLALPKVRSDKTQIVRFTNGDLFAKLDSHANVLTFEIYAEESFEVKVLFKYKNKSSLYEQKTVTLQQGLNNVSLNNLYSIDWEAIGGVEYVAFYFGEKGDSARNVYFGGAYLSTIAL